jgi:hypothetical protein
MTNLVNFNQANLPTVASLSTALRALEQDVSPAGVAILKMDKTGHWVYGADQTEIEDDSTWAVNPFSFVHGFIAWGDGEVLGEKMVSVSQPLPELEGAPQAAKRGWETQVGLSLKCLTGEDKGLEARFSTTSVGGKRAVQALAVAIANQVEANQAKPVPVILLKKEHYQHKSYGRIFTPVFDIVEWTGMDAKEATNEAEEATPAVEETSRRRRSV